MIGPPILSRPLSIASIHPGGLERTFSASAAERAALAKAYDLLEVKELSATLTVTPEPKGVVAVAGRVRAEIVQACVVTLEPVAQSIDEPVSARYAAADSRAATAETGPGGEIAVDLTAPDPPEILAGAVLDLGAIAVEHLVLAIDPYPRAPGATLPTDSLEPAAKIDSPFAALAGLRDKIAGEG